MSEENVEIIRRAYEALNSGGTEAFLHYMHPEFEGTTPPHLGAEPGTYRGHEGLRRYFDSFSEAMDDIRLEGNRFHDIADRVVVEMTLKARGKTTGIEVGQPLVQVWEIRDGQAFRLENFATLDEALEAAGLSE
jgi:ketosteroid isomerase-like protein